MLVEHYSYHNQLYLKLECNEKMKLSVYIAFLYQLFDMESNYTFT